VASGSTVRALACATASVMARPQAKPRNCSDWPRPILLTGLSVVLLGDESARRRACR